MCEYPRPPRPCRHATCRPRRLLSAPRCGRSHSLGGGRRSMASGQSLSHSQRRESERHSAQVDDPQRQPGTTMRHFRSHFSERCESLLTRRPPESISDAGVVLAAPLGEQAAPSETTTTIAAGEARRSSGRHETDRWECAASVAGAGSPDPQEVCGISACSPVAPALSTRRAWSPPRGGWAVSRVPSGSAAGRDVPRAGAVLRARLDK